MSHFSALVIGDNIEEKLAPYRELYLYEDSYKGEDIDARLEFELVFSREEAYDIYMQKCPAEDRNKTPEEWVRHYYNYIYSEEYGGYGFYHNPNAQWDFYLIGGRWLGLLKLKDGATGECGQPDIYNDTPHYIGGVDQARFGDIDWAAMNREPDPFSTYAVITEDGEWHSKGEMLGWGVSINNNPNWSNEYWDTFLKDLNPDTLITIVDCHI